MTLSGPMRCRAADRLASYPPGADRANGRGAAWPRLRPEPSQHYAKRQRHLQQVPFCMAGTADGTADGRIVWRPVSRVVRRRARLAPAAKGPGPGARPAGGLERSSTARDTFIAIAQQGFEAKHRNAAKVLPKRETKTAGGKKSLKKKKKARRGPKKMFCNVTFCTTRSPVPRRSQDLKC